MESAAVWDTPKTHSDADPLMVPIGVQGEYIALRGSQTYLTKGSMELTYYAYRRMGSVTACDMQKTHSPAPGNPTDIGSINYNLTLCQCEEFP